MCHAEFTNRSGHSPWLSISPSTNSWLGWRAGNYNEASVSISRHSPPQSRISPFSTLATFQRTIQVVPLTTTLREWPSDIDVTADGLTEASAAQCHLVLTIAEQRIVNTDNYGNVGPVALVQIRQMIAVLLDIS